VYEPLFAAEFEHGAAVVEFDDDVLIDQIAFVDAHLFMEQFAFDGTNRATVGEEGECIAIAVIVVVVVVIMVMIVVIIIMIVVVMIIVVVIIVIMVIVVIIIMIVVIMIIVVVVIVIMVIVVVVVIMTVIIFRFEGNKSAFALKRDRKRLVSHSDNWGVVC